MNFEQLKLSFYIDALNTFQSHVSLLKPSTKTPRCFDTSQYGLHRALVNISVGIRGCPP